MIQDDFNIHTDHEDISVPSSTFTPPRPPLAPVYPGRYLEDDDTIQSLSPGRRLTLAQEEARRLAMRRSQAAEAFDIFEDEDDDKDWNKENERP